MERIRTCRAKFTQPDWINGGTGKKNKRGVRACRCKWAGFENIYPFICIRVAEDRSPLSEGTRKFYVLHKIKPFTSQDADLLSNSSGLLKAFICDLITEIFRRGNDHISKKLF